MFCRKEFVGRGSMEMTVMSEGLLLNSKYIQMGREEGGFQALLIYVFATVRRAYGLVALDFSNLITDSA